MKYWSADLKNGEYKNPILHTDYSDPDVIAVNGEFYMIASSFTYLPGVPLLHSRDLVNWELINYCVKSIPFEGYDRPVHGSGTWAPAIRYHDGWFYVFVPLPDEGIFMTKTRDPYGEWTPLHCVKAAKGWIDPCPFWDEDGQAYMVHAFANSRCGIKHRLDICRMAEDASALLDEGVQVYDGELQNPTIEGPKLYKRNGYYYIFAPAGGVEQGWQTVLRSEHIYGPYEARIVMHQGDTAVNGPHQGGYVELEDGSSWFIHFQDRDCYGRIVHLQPMCWVADWPFIGLERNGDGIGEPVQTWRKPLCLDGEEPFINPSDEFEGSALGLRWQWQANPRQEWYRMGARESCLRLFSQRNPKRPNLLWYAPNLLTEMFVMPEFEVRVLLELGDARPGDKAGIAVIGHQYGGICIRRDEGYSIQVFEGTVTGKVYEGAAEEKVLYSKQIPSPRVYLRMTFADDGSFRFGYSMNGIRYFDMSQVFQAAKSTWTGAKFALYCLNDLNKESDGYCDIDYVRYE